MSENKAVIFGISRLRMMTDGNGVTTLVTLHGCPLRCKYCINPEGISPESKTVTLSPSELYDRLKLDRLYFLATGGGVTFGGGEPLLYAAFIKEFAALDREINIYLESSLNVPWENVAEVTGSVEDYFVDIKDCNSDIYRSYTGADNGRALTNLEGLIKTVGADKVTVRLPLIPEYNIDADRERSREVLERLGVRNFDLFTYVVKSKQ